VFFEKRAASDPDPICEADGGADQIYGGQSSFLPLKVNTAGVIPPIFAIVAVVVSVHDW
jgi:preprotein translocase subunit SecY